MSGAHAVLEEHLNAGRLDPAEAMSRHLLEQNPDDVFAHIAVARILAARGYLDDAIRRLERLLAGRPRLPEALAYLAVLWSLKGDRERALLLGKRASSLGARVAQCDVMLGDDAVERGAFPEARAFYDRAIQSNPKLSGAWFGRGKSLRATGDLADAEDALARAVELGPLRVEAWIELVLTEKEGGAYEAAAENLALALKAHPGHPDLKALMHDEEERRRLADDPVERALSSIRTSLWLNDVQGALRLLDELYEEHHGDPRLVVVEAEIASVSGHGDVPMLVNTLTRYVRERVTQWEPRAALGRLMLRNSPMQNLRMGVAHCEEAWRTSGEHPRAGIYLVEAYLSVGKRVHAHALAQKLATGQGLEAERAKLMLEAMT